MFSRKICKINQKYNLHMFILNRIKINFFSKFKSSVFGGVMTLPGILIIISRTEMEVFFNIFFFFFFRISTFVNDRVLEVALRTNLLSKQVSLIFAMKRNIQTCKKLKRNILMLIAILVRKNTLWQGYKI